jgi:hypothetical protein
MPFCYQGHLHIFLGVAQVMLQVGIGPLLGLEIKGMLCVQMRDRALHPPANLKHIIVVLKQI